MKKSLSRSLFASRNHGMNRASPRKFSRCTESAHNHHNHHFHQPGDLAHSHHQCELWSSFFLVTGMRNTFLCLQKKPREEESPVFLSGGFYRQLYYLFVYWGLAAFLSHWVGSFCGFQHAGSDIGTPYGFFRTPYGYILERGRFATGIKVFAKRK